jgi:hypothetical protein
MSLTFTLKYLIILAKFVLFLRSLDVILVNKLLSVVLSSSIWSLGSYMIVVSLSGPRLII